jgi:diguanylate cyclase (GGDEF)-like protein
MNNASLQTVLIVDDDRVNRTILAELLKDDCRVILAKDGPSALRRLQEEADVSLILLDVSMPDMDGYEVLRQLRFEQSTAATPVIFITALTEEEDEALGLSLGAVDYVMKPIRPAIVRARVRNHLKLAAQHRELERLAGRDVLTGLVNRRYFDQALDLACRHAARNGSSLGIAMVDVDHFKLYNDRYGHGAGDDALRQVAQGLTSIAQRPYDVVARYGGEEFVLLLPEVENFEMLLNKMRKDILKLNIPHADSKTAGCVTVSCGGLLVNGLQNYDSTVLLAKADMLLYEAKHRGRNRVIVSNLTHLTH